MRTPPVAAPKPTLTQAPKPLRQRHARDRPGRDPGTGAALRRRHYGATGAEGAACRRQPRHRPSGSSWRGMSLNDARFGGKRGFLALLSMPAPYIENTDHPLFFRRASPPNSPSPHPYSHSIVLSHGNALILRRKFFLRMKKNRLTDPSKIRALEFKREFRRFRICSVSGAIGIDRSILADSAKMTGWTGSRKKPSAASH
jgi:hypothetical protein